MRDFVHYVHTLLYGFAVGKALGWPVRNLSLNAIHKIYGQQGVVDLASLSIPSPHVVQLLHEPSRVSQIIFSVPGTGILARLTYNHVSSNYFLSKLVAYFEYNTAYEQALLRVSHVMGWGSENRALQHIGRGTSNAEILAAALYCILRYPDSLEKALLRAVNTDGESHKIAAIVGMIMTAKHGIEAVPGRWTANIPYLVKLSETAKVTHQYVFDQLQ